MGLFLYMFEDKINRLKKLQSDLPDIYKRIIKTNEDSWTHLIADDQMYNKGIDGNSIKIGDYTEGGKIRKRRKGQRSDHITLRDTGEFHSSLSLGLNDEGVTVYGDYYKNNFNLLNKYGEDILMLTKENKDRLVENIFIPALQQIANEYI